MVLYEFDREAIPEFPVAIEGKITQIQMENMQTEKTIILSFFFQNVRKHKSYILSKKNKI